VVRRNAGLIRRHDYLAEVVSGGPAAHCLIGHKDFDGIIFPTLRQVFSRNRDNTPKTDLTLIKMEFDSYDLR
jgi:hypothetical protein